MSINLVMNEEERRDRLRVTSRRKAATMFSEAFKMTNRRIKMDGGGGSLDGDETPMISSEDNSTPMPGLMLPFSEGEKRHLLGLLSNLHNQNNSRCYEFFAKDMEHLQVM